jgi:hypothetical protein
MHCGDKAARHAILASAPVAFKIESSAPRERKLRSEVNRVGSATHVALPGIGTGVAIAACLIAAKSKSRGTRLL